MKKPVWIGIAFLVVVLVFIVLATTSSTGYRVEICMDFHGQSRCKTASGTSEDFARRAAVTNACGEIASGVTDTIACENTYPRSIKWLKRAQ